MLLIGDTNGNYELTSTSSLGITSGGSSFGYPFPLAGNATSTLTQFNGGLTAFASSTIGNGSATGGLTVSGNSTTTGNAYFAGNVGIGGAPTGYSLETYGSGVSSFGATPQVLINGDNHSGGGLAISDDGGFFDYNDGYVTYDGTNGLKIAGNSGSGSLGQLYVNGNEYVENGNVGIGTTSPFATLSVAGNIFANGTITGSNITATGTLAVTGQTTLTTASSSALTATSLFSTLASTTNLTVSSLGTGGTTCVQADANGDLSSTGSACGSGGGSTVATVSNSDGTLVISPTSGAVVASLNLAHANTFSALQTFGNILLTGSSTLQNFTALNATTSQATTTNFAVTAVPSALLKTLASGAVVAAQAGVDYQAAGNYDTFGYLFPGNATSTTLTFGGGLLTGTSTIGALNATSSLAVASLNGFVGASNGLLYQIASSSLDLPNSALQNSSLTINGTVFNLGDSKTITAASSTLLGDNNIFTGANTFSSTTLTGNTLLANATSTSFFASIASSSNLFSTNANLSNLTVANALTVPNGGTGQTSFTSGNLLYGSGTGAVQNVATSSLAVGSSLSVSGTLGSQVGGTNSTLSLNLANPNFFTALQNFVNASTLQLTATSSVYLATVAGSVGIGNTNPGKTLDVTGTGRFSSTLTLSAAPTLNCNGSQALQTNSSGDISCGAVSSSGLSTAGGWTTNNLGLVSLATTTYQVLIGASSTSTLAQSRGPRRRQL